MCREIVPRLSWGSRQLEHLVIGDQPARSPMALSGRTILPCQEYYDAVQARRADCLECEARRCSFSAVSVPGQGV